MYNEIKIVVNFDQPKPVNTHLGTHATQIPRRRILSLLAAK